MKTIRRTGQFKRDVKRMERRGRNLHTLEPVLRALCEGMPLDTRYQDHLLVGQYKGTRECHIEPDWLLLYVATEDGLLLVRTGTHADLFS